VTAPSNTVYRSSSAPHQIEWAKPGDIGAYDRVAIDQLLIDHSYQRQELPPFRIKRLASEWNWGSCGVIVGMMRGNRDIYVVDGQQRIAAARMRGETEMPIIIFESDGPEHEARAFIALNINRKAVSAASKFAAAAMARLEPETSIQAWLAAHDFTISENRTSGVNQITFPAILVSLWKHNDTASKNAILAQTTINRDESLHHLCHKGFWWLFNAGVDVSQHIDKLKLCGGLPVVLQAIRALAIQTGTATTCRVCGLGALNLINHKRRRRIVPPAKFMRDAGPE
jgi:hypothetical protein